MRRPLALCLAAVAAAWPGGATAANGTECHFMAEFRLTPGLSFAPSSGAFTSGGRTGHVVCPGHGAGAAGTPHPFGAHGRYGTEGPDTCAGGEGEALQSFTVPGRGGPEPVRNPIRFVFRAASGDGAMAGHFEGERFSGTFQIVPLEGDCVTAPVTRVLLRGDGRLR